MKLIMFMQIVLSFIVLAATSGLERSKAKRGSLLSSCANSSGCSSPLVCSRKKCRNTIGRACGGNSHCTSGKCVNGGCSK